MVWRGKVVSHHWCDDCHSKESDWANRYEEPVINEQSMMTLDDGTLVAELPLAQDRGFLFQG